MEALHCHHLLCSFEIVLTVPLHLEFSNNIWISTPPSLKTQLPAFFPFDFFGLIESGPVIWTSLAFGSWPPIHPFAPFSLKPSPPSRCCLSPLVFWYVSATLFLFPLPSELPPVVPCTVWCLGLLNHPPWLNNWEFVGVGCAGGRIPVIRKKCGDFDCLRMHYRWDSQCSANCFLLFLLADIVYFRISLITHARRRDWMTCHWHHWCQQKSRFWGSDRSRVEVETWPAIGGSSRLRFCCFVLLGFGRTILLSSRRMNERWKRKLKNFKFEWRIGLTNYILTKLRIGFLFWRGNRRAFYFKIIRASFRIFKILKSLDRIFSETVCLAYGYQSSVC